MLRILDVCVAEGIERVRPCKAADPPFAVMLLTSVGVFILFDTLKKFIVLLYKWCCYCCELKRSAGNYTCKKSYWLNRDISV